MKFADLSDRQGIITTTPDKYIRAVAGRPPIDMSDEVAEAYIDDELADLKKLILAKRAQLQEVDEARARECADSDDTHEDSRP